MKLTDFNKSQFKKIEWGINTRIIDTYMKPKELVLDYTYPVHGIIITKDNGYGLGALIITENQEVDFFANVPASQVEDMKEILKHDEIIEDIKAGKYGFYVDTYESHGKTCYKYVFVE